MAHIRRHPKSGRWQVRYLDPDRRERSKTFRRKADAERFAATVTADVVRGEYLDPTAGRVTFGVYAERWVATRGDKARSTRDRDASYLRSLILPTFGHRPVASIRPSEIERWIATLDRASATRAKALRIVVRVLELARRDGAIKTNPASDVKAPAATAARVGRALNDGELDAVLTAADTVNTTTGAMVWLMARCGLRVGEVIALRRSDIDFDAGTITVATSMSRREGVRAVKGRDREDEGRVVPLPGDVAARLHCHLAEQTVADLGGFVFTAPRGGPIRYDNWRTRTWTRIVEAAGVGDVHPHDLRHTCATRLFVVDRWTPGEVQRLLGHRDPRITLAIYTHIATDDLPEPSVLRTADGHLTDT
jgi:integrase